MGRRRTKRQESPEAVEEAGTDSYDDSSDEETAIIETPSSGDGTRAVKMTVKEAEQKLFDVSLGYDVKLRTPFQEPPQTTAEDVFVYARVNLERCKKDKVRSKLAHKAAKEAVACLRKHFNAASAEDSKLHLRLYIADCYAGDREARIFSPGSGLGAARLCMVWMLCLPDGSVVLDGGRVGMTDDHMMGLWDILYLKTGDRTVVNSLVPNICAGIRDRINIARSPQSSIFGW